MSTATEAVHGEERREVRSEARRGQYTDGLSMARCVESLLRMDPRIHRMEHDGMRFGVGFSQTAIVVRVVPRPGIREPTLYARVDADIWWEPGHLNRASEVASMLASQILEQWHSPSLE